ncbi:MAG: DUF1302 domain-containing protein [Gammaproteobacteria bacterium]|nr:MAG: DUF1302 domain-containing protein [Gammaproteobacteria bacterium]
MMTDTPRKKTTRIFRLSLLSVAVTVLTSGPAQAFTFSSGDLEGSFDTTISYGARWRVQDRDQSIIGKANGGTANSVNGDDGNLNYDKGLVANVLKITPELELRYKNYGAFFRGYYFYDFEVMGNDTARTPLSDAAKDEVGEKGELLDAYVWGSWDVDNKPLDVRLGNQVINWGESTFIQGGMNSINPVNVNSLRVPGSELREAIKPVPRIWASLGATDKVSVEGFYQTNWEKTIIDPVGSYFSTSDLAGEGAEKVVLGFGAFPDNPAVPPTFVPKGSTREAKDGGEYGLAMNYLADNATEFGLYFVNYHSRLPIISAMTGTLAGALGGNYQGSARYFIEYPEDIKIIGASFNTEIGTSGISWQGELTYKIDSPLQIDDTELLFAALTPVAPALGAINQVGSFGFGQEISGFKRLDVAQIQSTITQVFSNIMGADQLAVVGEVGFTQVIDMPSFQELRFEGPGTYTSGSPFPTQGGVQPATEQKKGFATATSWGYRLLGRWRYNNVFSSINLNPRVAWAHDVDGTTPGPGGNFIQGRKALSLGLNAVYLEKWSADIAYTRYMGASRYNLINDRDFISFNIKTSF